MPKFYYTLCADVFQEEGKSEIIFQFESDHSGNINKVYDKVLKFLSVGKLIPPHIKELATRPTLQNGIHILTLANVLLQQHMHRS